MFVLRKHTTSHIVELQDKL